MTELVADLRHLRIPDVEGHAIASSVRASTELLPATCCAASRCGRVPVAARRTSVPARPGHRREISAARRGPLFTTARSSGENTVTRMTPQQVASSTAAFCRLTSTRLRPLRVSSSSTDNLATVVVQHRDAHDGAVSHRRGSMRRAGAAKAVERGEVAPSPRRGWSCPAR